MLQQFFIQSPNRAMQRTAGRRGGPCAVALGKMCIKQREHPSMDVLRAGPDNFLAKIKSFALTINTSDSIDSGVLRACAAARGTTGEIFITISFLLP